MRISKNSAAREFSPRELPEKTKDLAVKLLDWVQQNVQNLPFPVQNHLVEAVLRLYENVFELPPSANKKSYHSHISDARRATRNLLHLLHLIGSTSLPISEPIMDLETNTESLLITLNGLYLKSRQALEGESRD